MNNQMNNNENIQNSNSAATISQNQLNQNSGTNEMKQMGVVNNGISQTNSAINNQVRTGTNVSSGVMKGRRPLPEKVQKDQKYTENWINIKSIKNGIIYNKEGMMITGIKIQPKNIFILDQSQMDNTLIGLMNFYNTIEYEFWIIAADRPVDISMYQAELQLQYNQTTDQRLRKIISQDMDKGEYFARNNVVDTEYYILFKEKKLDVLQKKVRNLINNIAPAGITASQTSNEDLRMLVDNFMNAGRTFEAGGVMPL